MRLQIDQESGVPIYLQLERQIKCQIVSGRLAVGEQLPTVRQLAVDLTVNPNTVARVYSQLEREGLLSTRQGKGTFVAGPGLGAAPKQERHARLRGTIRQALADATASGYSPDEIRRAIEDVISEWQATPND